MQLPLQASNPGPRLLAARVLGVQLLAPPRRHPDVRHLLGDVVLVPPGVALDVAHSPVRVLCNVPHLTPEQVTIYSSLVCKHDNRWRLLLIEFVCLKSFIVLVTLSFKTEKN